MEIKKIYMKPAVRWSAMDSETVICSSPNDPDQLNGSVREGNISNGSVGAKRYNIWEDDR